MPTWDLKTQAQEAAIQTALESLAANIKGFDEDLKENSGDINQAFDNVETHLVNRFTQVVDTCGANKSEPSFRTDDTSKGCKRNLDSALQLSALAGLLMCISQQYLELLASKSAEDEKSTLTCETLQEDGEFELDIVYNSERKLH